MAETHIHEEWRPVPGFPMYEVSDMGRVRSNRASRHPGVIMTAAVSTEKNGYKNVHLSLRDGIRRRQFRLSRLVWEVFRGAIPRGYHVDHIDNNQLNNRLDNLQLLTPVDNNRKRWRDNPRMKSHGGVARKKVRCLETGVIFPSISEAARAIGAAGTSGILKSIKEPFRMCGGHHWAFA